MPRNTHNAGPMVLVSLSPPPLNPAATRQHNTHIQQGKHALRRCPPPPAPPPLLHYTEASERFVGYDKMYRYVLAQKRTRLPQGGSRECVALVCMAAPKRGMKCTCSQCPKRKRGTGERYTPAKIRSPSQGSLRVVLSFGGALPPRVSPCAHREEARMCLCERNVNVQRL